MWDTLGSDSEAGFCYLPSHSSRRRSASRTARRLVLVPGGVPYGEEKIRPFLGGYLFRRVNPTAIMGRKSLPD